MNNNFSISANISLKTDIQHMQTTNMQFGQFLDTIRLQPITIAKSKNSRPKNKMRH